MALVSITKPAKQVILVDVSTTSMVVNVNWTINRVNQTLVGMVVSLHSNYRIFILKIFSL